MNRPWIPLVALVVLACAACTSQAPEQTPPAPANPPAAASGPGGTQPPAAEPAAAAAAAPAEGETHACVSSTSCREFTAEASPAAWDARKMLCSQLRGKWTDGPCPSENVVATCTKPEGSGTLKLVCYGRPDMPADASVMTCQMACKDGGVFERK